MFETIAAAALGIMAPYLMEAGKGFTSKAGEKLTEKASEIYEVIKQKFSGDNDAEQVLSLAEAMPDSKGRQLSLQEVLTKKLETDAEFASTLRRLIEEAKAADTHNVIAFQRGVAIGGDANNAVITTGDGNLIGKP